MGEGDSIGGRGKKRGFQKAMFSLPAEQLGALREEAARRAMEQKASRMDTGAIVREAVDIWRDLAEGSVARMVDQISRAQNIERPEAALAMVRELIRFFHENKMTEEGARAEALLERAKRRKK